MHKDWEQANNLGYAESGTDIPCLWSSENSMVERETEKGVICVVTYEFKSTAKREDQAGRQAVSGTEQ